MENKKQTRYLIQLDPEQVGGSRWKDTDVGLRFEAYIITTCGQQMILSLVERAYWNDHEADVIVPLEWIKWMAPVRRDAGLIEEEHKVN